MGLFQFGRKVDFAKEFSFEGIPVFSSLSIFEQMVIEKKARLIEFKRGDLVYEEGQPSDAFYVVISGRFRLFSKPKGSEHEEKTLLHFYRGDHFGEASLLSGNLHSGSVEAKQDGLILKLSKEDFLKIISDIPAIALYLSRSLGHRLTHHEAEKSRREVKIAAVYSQNNPPGLLEFCFNFAELVKKESSEKLIVIDFVSESRPQISEELQKGTVPVFKLSDWTGTHESSLRSSVLTHPKGFHYLSVKVDDGLEKDEKKIAGLITFFTYQFSYLLLLLPSGMTNISYKALKKSDVIYVYAEADLQSITQCSESIKEFQKTFGFSKNEIKVIFPDEKRENPIQYEVKEEALGVRIFALLPSAKENSDRYQFVLRYLAKEWVGNLLGLALGSGAAYGLAHIGVLKVLEEEGIFPDVISGSSIGALVGGLWASGYNSEELVKIATGITKRTGFLKLLGLRDISIAHWGFFKGNQITKFFESLIGNKTFKDMRVPLKIVAADVFTSEPIFFETGRVVDAIRASVSIPGIFRPVKYQGRYLIDGGVVDPLPVQVLVKMGVKKIIGVNVLSSAKDRVERTQIRDNEHRLWLEAMKEKGVWERTVSRATDKLYTRYAINIFNVIMNTIQFMEYEIAESWGRQVDVMIHPIVPQAHWAEFYSAEKFIKMGEAKTREQLPEIKKILVEK